MTNESPAQVVCSVVLGCVCRGCSWLELLNPFNLLAAIITSLRASLWDCNCLTDEDAGIRGNLSSLVYGPGLSGGHARIAATSRAKGGMAVSHGALGSLSPSLPASS